ncbi:hypothetical protein HUU05_20875 [candidate division KSB1 bacterium]|nr:hypothetical protein [candidate division KSB1 bacterium]
MAIMLSSKYVCDASGKAVEVILPIAEFNALSRLAAKYLSEWRELTRANDEVEPIEFSAAAMTQIALQGGAFEWLKDEPDLYTDNDGEAV